MKVLIVLPVYNEESVLADSVQRVLDYCASQPWQSYIVIADSNSSDATAEISLRLARESSSVGYEHINRKGKGLAWKTVFMQYDADVYVFMDIDLATDLRHVSELVDAIESGSDIAIGSRYLVSSHIKRQLSRRIISEIYRQTVRVALNSNISDFQCGFKAMNQRVKQEVLPLTKDEEFFLDTELLLLAEKKQYAIEEIPITWSEFSQPGRNSTVKLLKNMYIFLNKIIKLRKQLRD